MAASSTAATARWDLVRGAVLMLVQSPGCLQVSTQFLRSDSGLNGSLISQCAVFAHLKFSSVILFIESVFTNK